MPDTPPGDALDVLRLSPEWVAFLLMNRILRAEKNKPETRELILNTYAECLKTVKARSLAE
jgi:hypothetical protein